MAQKDSGPAISLFSFQDIITSITGIMFLVVLLLLLLILEARRLDTPAANVPESAEQKELRAVLTALENEARSLGQTGEEQHRRLEELKKMDLDTVVARRDALLKKLEELKKQLSDFTGFIEKQKQQRLSLLAQIERDKAAVAGNDSELKNRRKNVAEQTRQAKDLAELLKRRAAVVRYTWSKNSEKTPVLAEISAHTVRTHDLRSGKIETYTDQASGEAGALFLRWAKEQPRGKIHYFLLAKPESFLQVNRLIDALREAGYSCGREVLPRNDSTIFSEEDGKK